jgi:hypothetical protein
MFVPNGVLAELEVYKHRETAITNIAGTEKFR